LIAGKKLVAIANGRDAEERGFFKG